MQLRKLWSCCFPVFDEILRVFCRDLKSAIAAAASLEREKGVVEEELRGVKASLERSRSTEKDLRAALKREQDMVVQGGKAVRALERQMVYDGVPPIGSPNKDKARKALSSLPPDSQTSLSSSGSSLTSRVRTSPSPPTPRARILGARDSVVTGRYASCPRRRP